MTFEQLFVFCKKKYFENQNPKNYIVENEINIVVEVKFAALKENILFWETMATSVQSLWSCQR